MFAKDSRKAKTILKTKKIKKEINKHFRSQGTNLKDA